MSGGCHFLPAMPDEIAAIHPAAPAPAAGLNAGRVIEAIAHPSRRAILGVLADSQARQVAVIAAAAAIQDTLAGKHLILLRKAGTIESVAAPDADGRKTFYRLPAHFVTRDAAGRTVLDFGSVALRIG